MNKPKSYIISVLEKLSIVSPIFGRPLLEMAVNTINKDFSNVSAAEVLKIIKEQINPQLSKGHQQINPILSADAGYIYFNDQNQIIDFNPAAKKLIHLLQIKIGLGDFETLQHFNLIKPAKELLGIEIREVKINTDKEIVLNISLSPIRDENKKIIGGLCIIQDHSLYSAIEDEILDTYFHLQNEIKLREKAEEELKQQMSATIQYSKLATLGEMASSIGHEINNPLAIINGKINILRKNIDQDTASIPEVKITVLKIEEMVLRISKIINGLKTYSRNAEHDPTIPYNLDLIIQDTLALCTEKIKIQQVSLEINNKLTKNILCRPTQIEQVLMNLIVNALDANEGKLGAWITIEAYEENNKALIKVTDSGSGISKENLNKIFAPFFTTKAVGKGTGLGLAICKNIIDQHGGLLSYNQTSKNTCFEFTLKLEVN